jgi:hypothetical protein
MKRLKKTLAIDYLNHYSYAVSEFEQAAVKHLRGIDVFVNKMHQWTVGCASQ